MAKNVKNETVSVVDGEKTLELMVRRRLPVVRINAEAVRQLFGLMGGKGNPLTYYPLTGKEKGNPTPIEAKTAKTWAKLPTGWNVGNRPIDPNHVAFLARLMRDGKYHAWAGNMLVISDDPRNGGKSMCNSQHTCAAYAVAISSGEIDEKYKRGIDLIFIDDFTDDIVDLLDNSKQRTTADAIARRGLADAKDAKIAQSVARFLTVRYRNGKTPTEAKEKVGLIDQIHAIENDARYQPIRSVLACIASQNRKDNGKGKAVKGSIGVFTKRFDKSKPNTDFRRFGLPYVWYTLAGVILVNGGKCDPAEFALWLNKIGYDDDSKLNIVEMALREALENHGQQERPGTAGHWQMCQSLIHAFNLAHGAKMPKNPPVYVRFENGNTIATIEEKETKANLASNDPKSLGMFWQGANDTPNGGQNGDELPELLPFTFGTDAETEVDAEMMDDESDDE